MTCVLIVEDDAFLAHDLAEQLKEAGFDVLGPALDAARGLALLQERLCDVAILDVDLGRGTSEPVAAELKRRSTPFITVSGYASDQHPEVFRGAFLVVKPVQVEKLITLLRSVV